MTYYVTEKKPKRYRLVKDLPTFKAGEIFELWDSVETQGLCRESDGIMAYHRKTLEKFPNILEEWFEEIKPAEPKITDPEWRRVVRKWYELNGLGRKLRVVADTLNYKIIGWRKDEELYGQEIDIPLSVMERDKDIRSFHTIEELCGEEEE